MNCFATALDMFKVDVGHFPNDANGLNDLVVRPKRVGNWEQYMASIPLDPWQHPYIYQFPGKRNTNTFDLSSAGPDGRPGTDDDIIYQPTEK